MENINPKKKYRVKSELTAYSNNFNPSSRIKYVLKEGDIIHSPWTTRSGEITWDSKFILLNGVCDTRYPYDNGIYSPTFLEEIK